MSGLHDMQLLKSIANSILRTLFRPVFKDIHAVDGKITNLSAQVEEKVANLSAQVCSLIQADLQNRHQHIDEKQDLHTRVLKEGTDKHDSQLQYLKGIYQSQNFSVYAQFGEALRPQFHHILHSVLGNDFPLITRHADQLFTEILIGHLNPGGIWTLQQDVVQLSNLNDEPACCSDITPPPENLSPLKICIVSGCFPSLMHGGGGRLLDIITELSTHHQIDLFTHFNPALDESSLELIKNKLGHIKLLEDYRDLSVDSVEAWLRSINRDAGFYDVIQLEYPHTVRFINRLRKYGKKTGFTFMECQAKSHTEKLHSALEAENYTNISSQAREFWQALADEKYALDHADFCVAVTDTDSDFLKRLSPRKTHIIPTCLSQQTIIEESAKYIDAQSEDHTVVFVGFFGHWPNIEAVEWYLADIHPLVKEKVPDYHFMIVGSGDVSRLKQLSAEDKTVTVTGMVDSIVPYILKAKVCVSPLISGAGIRGKQIQYAALGRPSVTTSIGNNGLMFIQGESVLIADNAHDFAEAIIRLLIDNDLYEKIQGQAREIALKHYTWPRHLEKLLALYR